MVEDLNLEFEPIGGYRRKRGRWLGKKPILSNNFNCGHPKNIENSGKKKKNSKIVFYCKICSRASSLKYLAKKKEMKQ
jgi:transcription elongation factor Elf1